MADAAAKWGVVITFVLSIVVNGLAATGKFGGITIGDLSRENPTFITPDGLTFAVWSVIYLLQTVLVCAQFSPSPHAEELLSERDPLAGLPTRYRIMLAFVANTVWLPAYLNLQFEIAMAIILVYLGVLFSVYDTLNTKTCDSFMEWLTLASGVACNASWICVAACANAFTVGRKHGWEDEYGVGGTPLAALACVLAVTCIAMMMAVNRQDTAWAGVACWACAGVYRMQTVCDEPSFPCAARSPLLAEGAMWSGALIALFIVVGHVQLVLIGGCKPRGYSRPLAMQA
mmetsp:Transcript_22188/g.58574  ORF Transcript_22188/g.58574 Transcript_22188/m.58574 type:complete len:287 (-) Transcript_22188:75-935(-)